MPFSDSDDTTHLWSELHSDCEPVEIKISGGVAEGDFAYEFFTDVVFRGKNETFATERSYFGSAEVQELAAYLESENGAISYFQLSSLFSSELRDKIDNLIPVAISKKVDGTYVGPKAAAFEDSSYPLARRLYLNLLDNEASLSNTRPFVAFGLSNKGTKALQAAGFWPVDDWENVVMSTRAQTEDGIPMREIQQSCGPSPGKITLAGSSTVFPVARIWSEIYKLGCPGIEIELEGGGSSGGAARVCADRDKGTSVMVGDMSRQWRDDEAVASIGPDFVYQCLAGDPMRSAIQVDVAVDGLTVATQVGGAAADCIQILGGLTMDQLRWMYTSYTDRMLEETGWDPQSLKNSDRDSRTHLWSELDSRCAHIEIRIAGADDDSGTYEYFLQTILKDRRNGETFDLNRPVFGYFNSEADDELVAYLREYGEAISYFGYSYYFDNQDSLLGVPIENDQGVFVAPIDMSIGDGSYNPLARRIFMNLWNDEEALAHTVPFVKFGLDHQELVSSTGYVTLPDDSRMDMMDRLNDAPYGLDEDGDGSGEATVIIIVIVLALVAALVAGWVCYKRRTRAKEGADAAGE